MTYLDRSENGSGPTTCCWKLPFAGVEEGCRQSTPDLILRIRHFAPKKATLGIERG